LRVPRRSNAKAGGTSYPGSIIKKIINRNAVASPFPRAWMQPPSGLNSMPCASTQRSRDFVSATLG
jgi:hypothetical protein